MDWSKKKDKALLRMREAILRFGTTLKREDDEGWEFYRQIRVVFNEMMARTRLVCGCQQSDIVSGMIQTSTSTETKHCCCSANKQGVCRCGR